MPQAATKPVEPPKKPKQGRSPAYPGIALEKALTQAKALYDTEGKYAVPMESAFTAWGFGAKSSGGRETRAALKYFGLITTEGDGDTGKLKVSEKALRILLDEREDDTEKRALIRDVALTPAIHKKLFEQYPDGLKSSATVEHFLVFEEGFNKTAAADVVEEFKATATYAGLYEPDKTVDKSGETGGGEVKDTLTPPADPLKPKVKVMAGERELTTGLLSKDAGFRLIVTGQIGVKEIEMLIKKLELDKEILAASNNSANED